MKRITATILVLALLAAMTSCNGTTNTPAETTAPETTETVTTAPVTEETSLPEFDINSEECLMYRLLDMTVEEIEAEFGELTLYGIILGGTPCYQLADLGILFYFSDYSDVFNDPLPRDMKAFLIETHSYDGVVYPGIYEGMDSKELIDLIGIEKLNYSISEIMGGFVSEHNVDGRVIRVRWDLTEEDTADFIEVYYNGISSGNSDEIELMLEDIAAKMRTGEIKGKVMHIFIPNRGTN